MAIDVFLYVALAIGFAAGRVTSYRTPWLNTATLVTVGLLVFFLGAEFGVSADVSSWTLVPLAFAFLLLIFALTLATLWLLPYRRFESEPPKLPVSAPVPYGVLLIAALLLGIGVGRTVDIPSPTLLTASLYVLLALVGFDLRFSKRALANAWAPVTAALVGATLAAILWAALGGAPLPVALATTLGLGFYSLAGPLVSAQAGSVMGILAFLVNFFRENVTMILAPKLGRKLGAEGLASMGGATSMDTTLYFIVRFGDAQSGSLALAAGLLMTLFASLALPLILSIPGA